MRARFPSSLRLRPGLGLLLVFVLTILLPGVLLAVFGLRTLWQERRLAEQQIREQLERLAELAGRDLERELARWQRLVEGLRPEVLPEEVRRVAAELGAGAVVHLEKQRLTVLPQGQIPHELGPVAEEPVPAMLATAEAVEFRQKDYVKAAALYQRALSAAGPQFQAAVLHRLARVYRKKGQREDALRIWKQLEGMRDARIGSLPAELVARVEVCSMEKGPGALELYRALVAGRWRLEKSRYLFYSEQARAWLPGTHPEVAALRAEEEQKLSLTAAVEEMLRQPRRIMRTENGTYLGFWRSAPFAAVVLSEAAFKREAWLAVGARLGGNFEASLVAPNEPTHSRAGIFAARALEAGWRIQVWPRNPAAMYAAVTRRQNLYLGMLVLVIGLLGFGGYLTVRVVRKELEVARLKADFVSAVSHEFRSPLTGIRQLGEMLMRGRVRDEERRQEYYRLITREANRLARLVENVLDFSRMEAGRQEYSFEPLEAGPWLEELVAAFRLEVAEKGYQVEASVPPGLPSLVADREALTLAVRNLLDNAVKYSPDSKSVWLEAEAARGGLSMRVCDHGVGIAPEEQRHVFEKFYRGRGELAKQVKGAGLGLSLVKHIVEAHGGSVKCASRPGEGSTFTIHLPSRGGERSGQA